MRRALTYSWLVAIAMATLTAAGAGTDTGTGTGISTGTDTDTGTGTDTDTGTGTDTDTGPGISIGTEATQAALRAAVARVCEERGLREVAVGVSGSGSADGAEDEGETLSGGYVSSVRALRYECRGRDLAAGAAPYTVHMVVKRAPPNVTARRTVPVTGMMAREIYFYERIAPLLDAERAPPDARLRYPRAYLTSDEYPREFVAMEDMRSVGFEPARVGTEPDAVDAPHATQAVLALARLHAHALALRATRPSELDALLPQLGDNFMTSGGDFDARGLRRYAALAFDKFVRAVTDESARARLRALAGEDFAAEFVRLSGAGRLTVISHGDYWINNLMFRYENGTPTEAAVLDFQMVRHSSVANDLLSLAGTCFSRALRARAGVLLRQYHAALGQALHARGLSPDALCPWAALHAELRAQSFLGLAMAALNVQFFDERPIEELSVLYGGDLPDEFFVISPTYSRLVNELVEDYASWGLL